MMRRPALVVIALASAVTSAVTSGACVAEFLPASVVVNERVIAVTASPPEAVPGQQVTLTPIVVAPGGELVGAPAPDDAFDATWWRCPDSDSDALGDFAQCAVPADRRDIATGVPYLDTIPLDLFGAPPTEPVNEDQPLASTLRVVVVIVRPMTRQ